MLNITLSQGRIGDRFDATIKGAARTARALESAYETRIVSIGKPAPAAKDDWRASLAQARETLVCLGEAIGEGLASDAFPIMVANTCSASLASLPRVAAAYPLAVVLWIDAHGDFNIPATTQSGYLGGMVLAAACGLWDSGHGAGLDPRQVILVGARDIDPPEAVLLRDAGVRVIPPSEATPKAVLDAVGDARVWIHIDWDVLEPGFVPADYAVPDGIFPTQLGLIFEALPADRVLGLEIAEFHPSSDEAENEVALSTILETISPVIEPHLNGARRLQTTTTGQSPADRGGRGGGGGG